MHLNARSAKSVVVTKTVSKSLNWEETYDRSCLVPCALCSAPMFLLLCPDFRIPVPVPCCQATENPMARLQAAFRAHIEADQCLHMVHCHHSPCNRRNPFVVCAVRGWKDHCFWHERQRVFERQIRSRMSVAVDSLAIGPYSVNLLRAISDGIERSIQECRFASVARAFLVAWSCAACFCLHVADFVFCISL